MSLLEAMGVLPDLLRNVCHVMRCTSLCSRAGQLPDEKLEYTLSNVVVNTCDCTEQQQA